MIDQIEKFIKNFDSKDTDPRWLDYINNELVGNKMSGAGILHLLNKSASFVDDDRYCYLEIGTYGGASLIATATENKLKCYGVDNFSQGFGFSLEDVKSHLLSKIKNYPNIGFFNSDFREFLKNNDNIEGKKAILYFFDGPHKKHDQWDGIDLATNLLADDSLIFIDDAFGGAKEAVDWSIDQFLKKYPKSYLVVEYSTPRGDRGFWEGLKVLRYRK